MVIIRSQDKETLGDIFIGAGNKCFEIRKVVPNECLYTTLGKYDTKERCIEVLNEIQKHKDELFWAELNSKLIPVQPFSTVYQMPER